MKKLIMLFAAILMMAGFTTQIMAQTTNTEATVSATTAGAVLIVPMHLGQDAPLHFGTMVLITAAGGTCVLSTANERSFPDAGVKGSAITPTSTTADYHVTGTYNETYAIVLPSDITVTETIGSTATMHITSWLAYVNSMSQNDTDGVLSATGTDHFHVGATLTVLAAQIGGIYAGTFPVTVDYN